MADVTTLLASAIQKSNEVIDLVKGKFSEWDKRVNDKIAWADGEVKKEIHNLESWRGTVDKNIEFKVGGDSDKFYPVIVTTGYKPFKFTISRDSIHWDSRGYGRCMYAVEGFTSHWGHGANFCKIIINKNCKKRFLARIYEEHEVGWVVLYLRGNTTYRFRTFFNNCNLSDYSTNVKSYTYRNNTVTFDIVNDGADTTYLDILSSDFVFDFTKDIPVKTINSGTIDTDNQ